nr:unnamed protein product [Callosobruchus chinensis]
MASDEQVQQIICDLKKLNKDSLVYLIVHGKTPTGVQLNDTASKYIEDKWKATDNANLDESFITVVDADINSQVCNKLACLNFKYDLKLASSEITYLNRLNSQQQSTIDSLNSVLKMLQDDRYFEVNKCNKSKQRITRSGQYNNVGNAPTVETRGQSTAVSRSLLSNPPLHIYRCLVVVPISEL